jgi:hypothetical protein
MADGFLGVFGHQGLEFALGALMVEIGCAGAAKQRRELGPGVRRGHVDDAHGFDPGSRRLDVDEMRHLAELDAAPELLFR